MRVLLVVKLVPDGLSEVLVEQGTLLTRLEDRLGREVGGTLKVGASNCLFVSNYGGSILSSLLFGRLSLLLRWLGIFERQSHRLDLLADLSWLR